MTCSALHKAKVSLAGSHPDSEMATCHLCPCRFQQALLCLGQPAADQALKFIQVFGKPLLSLQQTFAPFTPGDGGLAASTGTAAQEGPDCVPDRGLKSMLCFVTRQRWCPRSRFAPGGGFSSSQVPSSSCPVSAGAPHLWGRCVPGVPPRTTSSGLSCPRNHTLTSCPLPEAGGATTTGQLPSFPGLHKPLTRHVSPIPGTASTGDSPPGTLAWGQMSF